MTKRRLLYLPIETKARELLGKTFLAAKAVERGWIVVMGAHPDTRKFMLEHPAGLYVETSIPDAKAERLERIHSAGHRIANMCEESIVYADGRDYCTRKLGLELFALDRPSPRSGRAERRAHPRLSSRKATARW